MAEHATLDHKHKATTVNSGASSPALSSGRSASSANNSVVVHSPVGALSGGLSQPAGWQSLLSFTILFLAWLAGFSSRLFAVIRFESIIHEFDPW